jgi:hypothetical protein
MDERYFRRPIKIKAITISLLEINPWDGANLLLSHPRKTRLTPTTRHTHRLGMCKRYPAKPITMSLRNLGLRINLWNGANLLLPKACLCPTQRKRHRQFRLKLKVLGATSSL